MGPPPFLHLLDQLQKGQRQLNPHPLAAVLQMQAEALLDLPDAVKQGVLVDEQLVRRFVGRLGILQIAGQGGQILALIGLVILRQTEHGGMAEGAQRGVA